jgi:hypothetical protein
MTKISELKFSRMEPKLPYKYGNNVVVHQPGSGSFIQFFKDESDYEKHKNEYTYGMTWSVSYFDEYK